MTDVIEPQEQEATEERAPLLDDNRVAASPFEDYPGRLVFPKPNGRVYLAMFQAMKQQDDDPEQDLLRLVPHWRAVRAVAEIEIKGLDSLDFEDVPPFVIQWAFQCLNEYHVNFLTRSG